MRTFDSRHYRLLGFQTETIASGWLFEDIRSTCNGTCYILVESAKYYRDGRVFFLKEDGSIEDRAREAIDVRAVV